MATQYPGMSGNEAFHATFSIASSTNATPIVLQTTAPHDYSEGDDVYVFGHATNDNANGPWQAHVVDGTHISLWQTVSSSGMSGPSVGSGVGGATGQVRGIGLLPTYPVPSDGDALNASSVNPALEDAGDRSQALALGVGTYKEVFNTVRAFNELLSGAATARYGGGAAGITATDNNWKVAEITGAHDLDAFQSTCPDVYDDDLVVVTLAFAQVDTSDAALDGDVIGGGPLYIGIGYELFESGGSPAAVAGTIVPVIGGSPQLAWQDRYRQAGGAAADSSLTRQALICEGRLYVPPSGRFKKIQLYVAVREFTSAPKSAALWDDICWTVRIYRRTGYPA